MQNLAASSEDKMQVAFDKMQEDSIAFQLKMKKFEEDYRTENASQMKTLKKEETGVEIEELRAKIKLLMANEKDFNSRMAEKDAKINSLEDLYAKKLAENVKLTSELDAVKKEMLMSKLSDVHAEKDSSDVLSTTPSLNSVDAKSCASERLSCIFPFMFWHLFTLLD